MTIVTNIKIIGHICMKNIRLKYFQPFLLLPVLLHFSKFNFYVSRNNSMCINLINNMFLFCLLRGQDNDLRIVCMPECP